MFASTFSSASHSLNRAVIGAAGTLFFAGLCLAGAAAPAKAAEAPVRTKIVSYADLDLGSPQGRKTLEFRIRKAAREVCDHKSNDAWARASEAQCFLTALEGTRNETMAAIDAAKVG